MGGGSSTWVPVVMVPQIVVPFMVVSPEGDLLTLQATTGDDSCCGEATPHQGCEVPCEEAINKRYHAGFQRWLPVHPIPAASEGEWQTRKQKRQAAVELVTKSQEYNSCLAFGCQLPQAPDPSDRTMSKRHWEVQIMKFRDAVKAMSTTISVPSNSRRPRWADMVDDEDE